MQQILVTAKPDPNVHNLKNDKAKSDEEAKRKIQALEIRLKQGGEDFAMIAQNYSEDAATTPNGGDLGFMGESALDKTSPELKKLVLSLQPGQLSPIIHDGEGYRILKMISREPAGQRELSDPRVQQSIRETLLGRKDQLLKTAYYETARNESKVVNSMSRTIFADASQGEKFEIPTSLRGAALVGAVVAGLFALFALFGLFWFLKNRSAGQNCPRCNSSQAQPAGARWKPSGGYNPLECGKCGTVWAPPGSLGKAAVSWGAVFVGCAGFALAVTAFIYINVWAFAVAAATASGVLRLGLHGLKARHATVLQDGV
jgi:hypothetical protein